MVFENYVGHTRKALYIPYRGTAEFVYDHEFLRID
jgi:hypothetical protein